MLDRMIKPSLSEVVGRYVDLRRSGRELSGLCPLHSEKAPSFYVNEDKGTFYCHGCHNGGDVIRFIELIEGLDFKGALAHLGLNDQPRPTRAVIKNRETIRQASRNLAAWAHALSERIAAQMREIGQRAHRAQTLLRQLPEADRELLQCEIEGTSREWAILETLDDDLYNPELLPKLWEQRNAVMGIVHGI